MSGNGAVFLDRDGTIHEEVGYLNRLEQLKLFPGTAEAVALIHEMGRKAVVVTNQSGVARGFFDEGFLHEVHGEINARLEKEGTRIDAFYYCPHHPQFGTLLTEKTATAESRTRAFSSGPPPTWESTFTGPT